MKMKTNFDADGLMKYLETFSLGGADPAEHRGYLNFCFDRLLRTLELFPPGIGPGSRVLELGSSPYFMTLMMKKVLGCEVDSANFFGEGRRPSGKDVMTSEALGERHVFEYRHFNVEKDRFPMKNKSYDAVLFCEILEHLTVDPVHPLVEINGLLKDGGWMIMTTPNALRYENIAKLVMGRNIYPHYSGYGAYGRHNREYTPAETKALVEGLGFSVERLYTKVTGSYRIEGFSIKRFRRLIQFFTTANRGGNIYMLARKTGEAVPSYPDWLYTSMGGRDAAPAKKRR